MRKEKLMKYYKIVSSRIEKFYEEMPADRIILSAKRIDHTIVAETEYTWFVKNQGYPYYKTNRDIRVQEIELERPFVEAIENAYRVMMNSFTQFEHDKRRRYINQVIERYAGYDENKIAFIKWRLGF